MLTILRTRPLAVAIVALCAAFWCPSLSAQQAQPSPLEFVGDDPLVLSPEEPAQIQLRNNTPKRLTVNVRLIDLKPEGADPLSKKVALIPGPGVELEPSGGAIITLTLPADYKVDAEHSVAYLSAFESETNTFARRVVQVKKGGEGGVVKPKPLQTFSNAWSAEGHYSLRDTLPFGDPVKTVVLDTYLPLKSGATIDDAAKRGALAVILNDAGDAGFVEYKDEKPLPGGLQGVRLSFKSDACCGKFKGKINKEVGTEKDDVEVNVLVSHHWLYPLLALIAGVGLAFYFKERYVSVTRPLFLLEERRAQIEEDFLRAQAAFQKKHRGETYARYSVASVFNQKLAAALAEVNALRDRSFSTLDAEAMKKAQASLDELKALADEWAAFPARMAALKSAHLALVINSSTRRPPVAEPPKTPTIYRAAAALLNGGGEMTAAQLKEVGSEAVALSGRLLHWKAFNDKAADIWDDIHETEPPHRLKKIAEEKQERLTALNDQLANLWYDLWARADYQNEEMLSGLADAEKEAQLLGQHFVKAGPEAPTGTADDRSLRTRRKLPTLSADGAGATPSQRIWLYRLQRHVLDWLFLIVSVAIAVYTGFSQLYVGQAFGTWQDYVKIFLWGFGAQTTLTAVLTGLNLLWNSRASLRLS